MQEESENVYSTLHVEFSCIHSLKTVYVSRVFRVKPPDYYTLVTVIFLDMEILQVCVPVMKMCFWYLSLHYRCEGAVDTTLPYINSGRRFQRI